MRLLRAYENIGATIPNEEVRRSLAKCAHLIGQGCALQLPEEEKELRSRLKTLEAWL